MNHLEPSDGNGQASKNRKNGSDRSRFNIYISATTMKQFRCVCQPHSVSRAIEILMRKVIKKKEVIK